MKHRLASHHRYRREENFHVTQPNLSIPDIVQFAGTFKEFPPRSIPPSFNPATIMDQTIREIRVERKLREVLPLPAQPEKSN